MALLCACGQVIDPARVVVNPIDLDYEFTKGEGMGGGAFPFFSLDDPNLMDQVPEEFKPMVKQLLSVPGALEEMMARTSPRENYREAADPVCILYKGHYYLFVSKSDGYWSSDDMLHWRHIRTSVLPMDLYAPTAMEYKGELYWMTSDLNSLWKTTDPEDGEAWVLVTDQLTPYPENPARTGHDPDLFLDSDGRVFLYWGCSNVDDIMGIELDPENNFQAKGLPVTLITHKQDEFGWERPGNYNEPEQPGYNEGATIFKKDGRYYLQYATPGTEFFTYGEGLYVADAPLGPYTHYAASPVSVKPGGWMKGAGHGDTFQDKHGNWWHVASTVISQRHHFERRIGFFPVFFTKDGGMNMITWNTDLPYRIPDGKMDFGKNSPWTGWMDLSIGKTATASSELERHNVPMGADHDIQTWWSAATGNAGEWFCLDLGTVMDVWAVQANFADEAFPLRTEGNPFVPYKYVIETSADGAAWTLFDDRSANAVTHPHSLSVVPRAIKARYVRITSRGELPGKFSLFDLRVFGKGGKAPAAVQNSSFQRTPDGRTISFQWQEVPGANGYYLRWGTNPDELYSVCECLGKEITLGLFSRGQQYYYTIDSFSEGGVTPGWIVKAID